MEKQTIFSGGNVAGWAVGLVTLGVGGYFVNKYIQDLKAKKEAEKVGADGEQQATSASQITDALNPSGINWLKKIDGSNVTIILKALEDAIRKGKTFEDLSKSYAKLNKGASLLTDLKNDLSTVQYDTFVNVIKLNNPKNHAQPIKPGGLLIAKSNVRIRKTPYINDYSPVNFSTNQIATATTGLLIGMTTGRYKVSTSRDLLLDKKATQSTLFYEVQVFDLNGVKYNCWVAGSLVTFDPIASNMKKHKRFFITKRQYDNAAASTESGLKGLETERILALMS